MSTRTFLKPYSVITNGDMSATSITSAVTIMQSISGVSYQLSWSGSTPIGSVALQFSNDYSLNPDGTVNNSGTWTTATINVAGFPVSSAPVSGNTGSGVIDVDRTNTYASRLVYTKASGTGTLQAVIMGKVS